MVKRKVTQEMKDAYGAIIIGFSFRYKEKFNVEVDPFALAGVLNKIKPTKWQTIATVVNDESIPFSAIVHDIKGMSQNDPFFLPKIKALQDIK